MVKKKLTGKKESSRRLITLAGQLKLKPRTAGSTTPERRSEERNPESNKKQSPWQKINPVMNLPVKKNQHSSPGDQTGRSTTEIRKYFQKLINDKVMLPVTPDNQTAVGGSMKIISENKREISRVEGSRSPNDESPGPDGVDQSMGHPTLEDDPLWVPKLLCQKGGKKSESIAVPLPLDSPVESPLQPGDGSTPEPIEKWNVKNEKLRKKIENLPKLPPEGENVKLVSEVGHMVQVGHDNLLRSPNNHHIGDHNSIEFSENKQEIAANKVTSKHETKSQTNSHRLKPKDRGRKKTVEHHRVTLKNYEITKYFKKLEKVPENPRTAGGDHQQAVNNDDKSPGKTECGNAQNCTVQNSVHF